MRGTVLNRKEEQRVKFIIFWNSHFFKPHTLERLSTHSQWHEGFCCYITGDCHTRRSGGCFCFGSKILHAEHAEIEVVKIADRSAIADHFMGLAKELDPYIEREVWDWGENHPEVLRHKEVRSFYASVAEQLKK